MIAGNGWLLAGALLEGSMLGAVFFGGLWLTVRHAISSTSPGLWLLGSYVLRTAIVLAGFYAACAGGWPRLLACLLGFMLARFIVGRTVLPRIRNLHAAGKVLHAP